MNNIINKLLLAEDQFMQEIHLSQPGLTNGKYRPSTKNKERIQKFKEIGESRYICQNELDKMIQSMMDINVGLHQWCTNII